MKMLTLHTLDLFILCIIFVCFYFCSYMGGIVRGQFELFYQLVGNNGLLFSTTDILDTYVYRATIKSPDSR